MKVRPASRRGGVLLEIDASEERLFGSASQTDIRPLFKIKKILVPVDFSECSKKALAYAVPFAKQFGATIDVLYVIPPYYALDPYGVTEYERVERQLRASGEQKLAALVLEEIPQTVPVEILVRTGRAAQEIVDAAKELETDLIIIATHGRNGLKHMVIGSTAENVVRQAPCPVLTVREKEHEFITE